MDLFCGEETKTKRNVVISMSGVLLIAIVLPAGVTWAGKRSSVDETEGSVSTLLEVLSAIYDYDKSKIPDEPNEIIALETSSDSRDLLAWEIFKLIRYELDPNSRPPEEIEPVITHEGMPDTVSEISIETDQLSPLDFPVMTMSLESEPAIELSGPLDSCILESRTYRITELPLEIEGHVVIPSGARLIAPYDPNNNIIEVMPGGLLDMGKAAFYGTEEFPDVLPAVEILPEDPNILFAHNYAGIYIHRGADPKTRIENVEISGCRTGIVVDESLHYPLRNVVTIGCYDGVHLFAPAGIIDCEFRCNGSVWDWMSDYIMAHLGEYRNGTLFESIAVYAGAGIYVCPDGQTYPYPEVFIERTVVYDGDVGLYIAGEYIDPNLPNPNEMAPLVPQINIVNSCIATSYFYGVYQSEGESLIDLQYCAFGNNQFRTNIDLPFTECIELSSNPFYSIGNRLYAISWSELTDAGYGIATDGTGTCHDRPDIGVMDIGCHFPLGISGGFGIPSSSADFNWDGIVDEADLELMNACMGATDDPNLLRMDFNYDSRINMPDYGVFSFDYGYSSDPNVSSNNDPNCRRSDFNGDLQVDVEDLVVLAENWLTPVFDEYRICSLCNLHTGIDPNNPNASSGIHIIDERDRNVFMADWGKEYVTDPNIQIGFSDSELTAVVQNPSHAWGISAFLDDQPIGRWDSGGLGYPVFTEDMTRYGPGSHKLKIVSNIEYGLCVTEMVISGPIDV